MNKSAYKCEAQHKSPFKAIFLDRDGVINVKLPEGQYVKSPDDFILLPDVAAALRLLRQLGYLLVVATNQRGIALGFMTEEDLSSVHAHMKGCLGEEDALLDRVYYCPHDDYERCDCRKPQAGMLSRASDEMGISLADSFMVGDSEKDIAAGKSAGTWTVRIGRDEDPAADFTFPSLMDFALFLRNAPTPQSNEPGAMSGVGE